LVLSLCAIVLLLSSMIQIPYAVQLATGLERLGLIAHCVWLVVLVPLTWVLVARHGAAGGAASLALGNAGLYLFLPYAMHRKVLKGHQLRWIFRDTLPYMIAAVASVASAAWIARKFNRPVTDYVMLAAGLLAYGAVAAAFSRDLLRSLVAWRDGLASVPKETPPVADSP
jgi:O-antigen/teichoic acid export membrane protein